MANIEIIGITELVSDVAVDPVHVRELADSIKVSGPISPVMVRQDSHELIDGFHRVAAMQELGFNAVECIITPCDDETFWDLRITAASMHKAVTFSRAVDWIEECFRMSQFKDSFKNVFSLFDAVIDRRGRSVSPEARAWVENKCQKWGLAAGTIRQWLYTKQSLDPALVEEARNPSTGEGSLPFSHYYRVAETLPNKPDLQKAVIGKAKAEGLTGEQTRQVARAVASTPDPAIVSGILIQPVSRTADELTRSARVERMIDEPKREPSPRQQQRDLTGVALDVFLSLEQQVHNISRLTDPVLESLTDSQWAEMTTVLETLETAIQELLARRVTPKHTIEGEGRVVEGQLVTRR